MIAEKALSFGHISIHRVLPIALCGASTNAWSVMISRRLALVVMAWAYVGSSLCAAELTMPRLEVFKAKRELQLFDGDKLIKTWRVALGMNPKPSKEKEGDRATPEGSYYICRKNPKSQYHLSLGISYPGPLDAERGFKAKMISENERKAIHEAHRKGETPPWKTALGGEIFIHGSGSKSDWTLGCIALENSEIEELYKLIPVRTPITIHP